MKNKLLIIALAALIVFSMVGCSENEPEHNPIPETVTYQGTIGGVSYTLKITENISRAAYAPKGGDNYELSDSAKKSTGTVKSISGGTLTLLPSAAGAESFTATVSESLITAITGTITFDDGTKSNNGDDNNNGNNLGIWHESRRKHYIIKDGEASLSYEFVYNYIMLRYISKTNYERKYTLIFTNGYDSTETNYLNHYIRNGQQLVVLTNYSNNYSNIYASTGEYITLYDSESSLILNEIRTDTTTYTNGTTNTITSEYSYTIQLLNDTNGVKTYKYFKNTEIRNNVSQDVSKSGYREYKIQDEKILEEKSFSSNGELTSISTYTYIILVKLGSYHVESDVYPSMPEKNTYQTVEVLSDSATELIIRLKEFRNNILNAYSDITYEIFN